MAKIACDCLSKDAKELVERSNLDTDLKKQLLDSRTCGEIKESDIIAILNEDDVRSMGGSLKIVIPKIMKHGLTKGEADEQLLRLHRSDKIFLEMGSPIGVFGEELEKITISTPRARYTRAIFRRR